MKKWKKLWFPQKFPDYKWERIWSTQIESSNIVLEANFLDIDSICVWDATYIHLMLVKEEKCEEKDEVTEREKVSSYLLLNIVLLFYY